MLESVDLEEVLTKVVFLTRPISVTIFFVKDIAGSVLILFAPKFFALSAAKRIKALAAIPKNLPY